MTSKNSRFWDRLAKRYAKKAVPDKAAYEMKLAKIRDYLDQDTQVLELGCGTGSTALALAADAKEILATDFSATMIEIARSKAAKESVNNVRFQQVSVGRTLQTDHRVDMVMAHSVLHLLDNPFDTVAQIQASLKPGGVFVQNTPCLGDTGGVFKVVGPLLARIGLIPKIQMLKKERLMNALEQAGFVPEFEWQSPSRDYVFLVSRKPANTVLVEEGV